MKRIFTLLCGLAMLPVLHAQTWNGSTSNDWFTAANWTPNTVPTAASNVTIPGFLSNYPALTGNVSIQNLTLSGGSQLHTGGFTLTASGVPNFNNAAIDGGGAIVFNAPASIYIVNSIITTELTASGIDGNINFQNNNVTGNTSLSTASTSSTNANYIGGNNFYGNLALTHAGTGNLNTAYYGQDQITGDCTYTISGSGGFYAGYYGAINIGGNLSVTRTSSGVTSLFENNSNHIVGDKFTYTNTAGGGTNIGNTSTTTLINGSFSLNMEGSLKLYRIKNLSSGGLSSVTNPSTLLVQYDTLITSFQASNVSSSIDFRHNHITGNTALSSDATNTSNANYIGDNYIDGTCQITHSGTGNLYTAYYGKDKITGACTYTLSGTGAFYGGYYAPLEIGGNLTVTRTVNGITSLFENGGAHLIGGDFSYTTTGGNDKLGNTSGTTLVNGACSITKPDGSLTFYRLKSLTTGGTVQIGNVPNLNFQNDTLMSDVTITNISGSTDFRGNQITGNVSLATGAANGSNANYVGNNTIYGNVLLEHAGSGTFNLAYYNPDIFQGNCDIILSGPGAFYGGYYGLLSVTGNLNVTRNVSGFTGLFQGTFPHSVEGNFSFNTLGGNYELGNTSVTTTVSGAFSLNSTAGTANVYRIKNLIGGGALLISNPASLNFKRDTISSSLNIEDVSGDLAFQNNRVTGNVVLSTATASGTNSNYLAGNTVSGDFSLVHKGNGSFYESYYGSDIISGKDSIVNAGAGTLYVGHSAPHIANGSFITNAASGLNVYSLTVGGNDSALIKNYGAQPLSVGTLVVNRSSAVPTMLETPMTITGSLTFTNGYIKSSATNPLIFANNVTHTGAGNASHAIGAIQRTGTTAFEFPLGNGVYYSPLTISPPGAGTNTFQAQYIDQSPAIAGYDTAMHESSLHHVSNAEYWLLNRLAGTSVVYVSLSWSLNSKGVDNLSALRVARWNGSQWNDEGHGVFTGNTTFGYVRTDYQPVPNGPFTLASVNASNPLPLRLISFDAYNIKAGENRIEWQTATEDPNTFFEVERSTDGKVFTPIASVVGRGVQGGQYNIADNDFRATENFYRLKAFKPGGSAFYSQVVRVVTKLSGHQVSIAPNPAKEEIIITNTDERLNGTTLLFLDMQGRVTHRLILQDKVEVNVASWPAGIYLMRLQSGHTVRLVKE